MLQEFTLPGDREHATVLHKDLQGRNQDQLCTGLGRRGGEAPTANNHVARCCSIVSSFRHFKSILRRSWRSCGCSHLALAGALRSEFEALFAHEHLLLKRVLRGFTAQPNPPAGAGTARACTPVKNSIAFFRESSPSSCSSPSLRGKRRSSSGVSGGREPSIMALSRKASPDTFIL